MVFEINAHRLQPRGWACFREIEGNLFYDEETP